MSESEMLYCANCDTAQPREALYPHSEPDVNYYGYRCSCGVVDDLEDITPKWAIVQMSDMIHKIQQVPMATNRLYEASQRLRAARDELEGLIETTLG